MDWKLLREKIYYLDGSLRDIYVRDTGRDEWETWINFVNNKYQIEFIIEGSDEKFNQIDKNIVFNYWDSEDKLALNCAIKLGDLIIKCYFFGEDEIENDITPLEINTIEDHNNLLDYLKSVSLLLNKRVILCEESYSKDPTELIVVDNENVQLVVDS